MLDDFKKLSDYNELDLIAYMIELLNGTKRSAEKTIKGNKTHMLELRKHMNDISNLAHILRGMVGIRMGITDKNVVLEQLMAREAKYAKKLDARERGLEADAMLERIIQVRLAEKQKREERDKKRKEERIGTIDSENKKTPDQL